jgi:general secretion pathway protein H
MKGFTLLELMIVLAIAVLGAAIVVPRLASSSGAEIDAAARTIEAGFRQARGDAVATGAPVVVTLDLQRKRLGRGAVSRPLPDSLDYRVYTARSEVASQTRAGVRFFPDGSSTGGRITATDGRSARHVDVDWLTGRVRVRDRVDAG